MGTHDVPQWLISAFARSCRAAGATASRDDLEATARRLLDRWNTGERHHHTVRHVVDVLARVEELSGETHHPDLVRLAAWYHGAVFSTAAIKAYARAAGEDKEASAHLAIEELGALGVPADVTDRIAFLILNLKRHDAPKDDIDAQALCDADLGAIADDPQKYRAYREGVRKEFAHIPLRHYLEGRTRVIERLLSRKRLFASPMAREWEDTARQNLGAELARLTVELDAMGECAAEDHLPEPEDVERSRGVGSGGVGSAGGVGGRGGGGAGGGACAGARGRSGGGSGPAVARRPLRDRTPADRDFVTSDAGETTSTIARVKPAAPLPIPAGDAYDSYGERAERDRVERELADRDPADRDRADRVERGRPAGASATDAAPGSEVWAAANAEQRRAEPRHSGLEAEPEDPRRPVMDRAGADRSGRFPDSGDGVTAGGAAGGSAVGKAGAGPRGAERAVRDSERSARDSVPTMLPPDRDGDPVPRNRRLELPQGFAEPDIEPVAEPLSRPLPPPVPGDPGPDFAEPHELVEDDERQMPSISHAESQDDAAEQPLSAMEREPDLFTRRDRKR